MAKLWSLKGDAESAERKFQTICLWLTVGRSSEAAWLQWDTMDWDSEFNMLFAELPQSKVSAVKLVAFMAGNTAESCFYTCLGDYLVMCAGSRYIYEPGEPAWVFPSLQKAKSPGVVLGGYMKALQAKGAELPATINASFFRGGAANFMALFMPAEFVAASTGHMLNGRSALYEYLEVGRALLMPGAVVLAGWPALPWGQLGLGAAPPSFEVLEQIGVGMDLIQAFVVRFFHLDSSSPAPLLPSGGLWKATLAAAASLVMYYVERCEARPEKMPQLIAQMRGSFSSARRSTGAAASSSTSSSSTSSTSTSTSGGGGGIYSAHEVLSRWSGLIATAFRVANLHLTARTGPAGEGAASVVAAVDGIASAVGESRRAALDLHHSLESQLRALTLEVRTAGGNAGVGSVDGSSASGSGASGGSSAIDSSASGSGAGDSAGSAGTTLGCGDDSGDGMDEVEDDASGSKKRKVASIGILGSLVGSVVPKPTLGKQTAVEIFLDGMNRHGNANPQLGKADKARAKGIIDMFKALATQAEVNSHLPPRPEPAA